MKAFRKDSTPSNPLCVYFTDDEASDLVTEAAEAIRNAAYMGEERMPELERLHTKLRNLTSNPERRRA
ncbi:gp1.2 [Streptomyces phage phiBT1]|uniref:Gp1.2 n=1 Tax=Lomovskayavirus BT1 TaxID=225588 RepID=Q859A1_9CAUD|nr:gp1.2 [Streptomyces phage phiBT1]CAD80124.1 gp1.2 [Lomovskayavirus BT1]